MSAPEPERREAIKRRKSNRDFWRACGFLWPYRRTVAVSIGCAFLTGFLAAGGLATLVPLLNILVKGETVAAYAERAVQNYAAEHGGQVPWHLERLRGLSRVVPEDPVWAIAAVFGFIFFLGILGSVTRFFQEYLSDSCAIAAINDIRKKLYHHVLHLPVGYFARHGTGDLTARLVTDAQGLQDGFKTILGKAIQEPITACFALAVAMWIDWRLTVFVIVFTPLMVVVIRKLGTKVRRTMRATLEKNARMLGQIESTLAGVRVVKSAAAEPHERRRYRHIMNALLHDQRKMARYEAWSTPTLEMLGLVACGCVLMFASYLAFRAKTATGRPELEPSSFIALMMCLVAIAEPLRRISKLNNVLQRGNAAARRIFDVLETPAEVGCEQRGTGRADGHAISNPRSEIQDLRSEISDPRSEIVGSGSGIATLRSPLSTPRSDLTFDQSIRFEDVVFAYPGANHAAIDGVSLTVPKGTSVAVVGRNGSGKTTLLSLLPRFFDPNGGAVRIDGVDVRDWPIRRLRRMIGVVTQDAVVFPGTIAENIAYGDPRKSRDQIVEASRRAHAHEFIAQKPQGYDTPLDGLGSGMSGGQRQRLNIARAILRDTPILILDEATSQVDAESEHLIQQAIAGLMRERTTFVIAHRFSTILSADLIVVMEQGRLAGVGKHDDLLRTCEIYKQLYERQLFAA